MLNTREAFRDGAFLFSNKSQCTITNLESPGPSQPDPWQGLCKQVERAELQLPWLHKLPSLTRLALVMDFYVLSPLSFLNGFQKKLRSNNNELPHLPEPAHLYTSSPPLLSRTVWVLQGQSFSSPLPALSHPSPLPPLVPPPSPTYSHLSPSFGGLSQQ